MISLVPYPLSSDSSDSEDKEKVDEENEKEEEQTHLVWRDEVAGDVLG